MNKQNDRGISPSIDRQPAAKIEPRSRPWIWGVVMVLATLITVASGILQGRMSQRWGSDEATTQLTHQLELFPEQVGPWRQEEAYELGADALELLQCYGYIQRGYRHEETGDYLKLAVIVGPGSKMSIHVPEICYEASNFTLLSPRERVDVKAANRDHSFWGVTFQVNDVSERTVRVLYGWSAGQQWLAPLFPRWSVAGYPILYKLQLSFVGNDPTTRDQQASDEEIGRFLDEAIAILDELIQPPSSLSSANS